jgi:ubiquinone/menaquinone biosynthesis C-methylase UbiE
LAEDAPVDPVEPAFAGETAWYYARYRREYPTQLVEHLRPFAREGQGRLLDLGCGTGQLLLQLVPYFKHGIGIDPEPDMLREAARLAHERGIHNAEWIQASSSDLPNLATELGLVDLVTIATAFHFMEPQSTLHALMRLVRAGGAVAVAYNGSPMWLHPEAWAKGLRRVLEAELGSVSDLDVATEGLRACELAMHELGYTEIERWQYTYESVIDIDFIVGHIYTALSPGRIPPNERPSFEQRIKREITAVAHSGHVSETVAVRVLIGRPPITSPMN